MRHTNNRHEEDYPIFGIFNDGWRTYSCQQSEDEKASTMMQRIDSLYKAQDYQSTLNAITQLRETYPKAIESRKRALKIWQEASLKMAQNDIGRTDSALQATIQQYNEAKSLWR